MHAMIAERFNDGVVGGEIANQCMELVGGNKGVLADSIHFAGIEQGYRPSALLVNDLFGVGFFVADVG